MVHTSFITVKLSSLSGHPDNERIYSPTDLSDLESSLSTYGQLEPLAVTKDNRIISGHRRYMSMRSLGWEECDVRIVEPEDEIISLIEHNRHRSKTNTDILNEARFLEKQLRNYVGRGRNTARERVGKKKGERLTMAMELSQRLGIGTTKLKQLLSISNYEPEMISKIDSGEISVSHAYEIVRNKHIKPKNIKTPEGNFKSTFTKMLKQDQPSIDLINETIKTTYPYSLELTGVSYDRRDALIEHLERLKKMDSREILTTEKQSELDNHQPKPKELDNARSLLPSYDELDAFWNEDKFDHLEKLIIITTSPTSYYFSPFRDKKIQFDSRLWNTLRICIHSQVNNSSPGRSLFSFVGFENKKGFRLLGLISLNSDSRQMKVRDEHIGWTSSQNTAKREHLVNLNNCCPTQPFGFNMLGGKFISLVAAKLIPKWEEKYKTKVVGITTTSLFGSQSQYQGMKWWKHLGTSSGQTLISPLVEEWTYWREWLIVNYPKIYEEDTNTSSPKQKMISSVLKILGINQKDYFHNHKRGVFFCPLYSNYREFLTGKIKLGKLEPISHSWFEWWSKKSKSRLTKLTQDKKVKKEVLFVDNINEEDLINWLDSKGI